jgi:triphosphoribosyl-dephospho-CoA synthase
MADAGLAAQVACVWEVTARKPGNVHRGADFEDLTYLDFLLSAAATGPVLAHAAGRRVGSTVLECIRATRRVVTSNTNLGIVLLLAPLAAVTDETSLRLGLAQVLAGLDLEDARLVYEAIRLAQPGGLGQVAQEDVRQPPTQTLRDVMALAAGRDGVARQYTNDFADIFDEGVPELLTGLGETRSLEGAILFAQLRLLSRLPDSLIARKRGPAEAAEASNRAEAVLRARWPHTLAGWVALRELDAWLRAVGHQRNPGTTADLLTASLFVLLRQGTIPLPSRVPWAAGFDHD